MRTFIAALEHETNSFSPISTNLASYQDCRFYIPKNKNASNDNTSETIWMGYSDFIKIAKRRGHIPLVSIAAIAQPSAPTCQKDYEILRDLILDDLRAALPVDMVLLFMHGAQMAENQDDCEGDLLARTRKIVGPSIPIGCELDLHCNISPAMLEAATILMTCKEYPHTDFPDRALDLYNLIQAAAEGKANPHMHFFPVPMLSKFYTTRDPMKSFVTKIKDLEQKDGILSISLVHSFPWSDTPHTRAGIIIITDGVQNNINRLGESLAHEFYGLRHETHDKALSIDDALKKAIGSTARPIIIADCSDNAGGGAPGDSTFILEALIKRKATNVALAMICDPQSVKAAMKAGVGKTISFHIGGKHGAMSGPTIKVDALITALATNPTQRGLEPGRPELLGESAAVRVNGIDIVLNSIRQQVFSPDVFTKLGVDPNTKSILVIKSSQHFYTLFAPIVNSPEDDIIYCDAPGALNSKLSNLPYKNLTRPIWPLDDDPWEAIAPPQSAS